MNKALASAFSAAVLSLAGCAASPSGEVGSRATKISANRITYAIGPCRGFCASYTFAITADGTSEFIGEQHTTSVGKATPRTSRRDFDRIAAALAPVTPINERIYSRQTCSRFATDQQVITVTWSSANHPDRTLQFNLGCHDDNLEAVRNALAAARRLMPIDDLVGRATTY